MKRRYSYWASVLMAVILPVLLVSLRLILEKVPEKTPFLHSGWVTLLCAWLGGLVPGLIATATMITSVSVMLVPPSAPMAVSFVVVFFQGLMVACFGEARLRAVERWRQLTRELETRVAERTSALSRSNAKLENEAAELERAITDLTDAGRQLQASNRELETFASVASHDLQEPLRKIRTFSDRLMQRQSDRLDEEGRDYLARSAKAAERMSHLIDDLLTYSRVTTRGQPLRPVSLSEVVEGVLSDLEDRIAESQAWIEFGPLPSICADAAQMRQLFQNLIANALKFVAPGEPPMVRIFARIDETVEPAICHLSVADHGIGIEPQYRERIFEMFQRLHGRDAYEGTGIGLAICRKIAERHGGTIGLEDSPGGGSIFVVSLPVVSLPVDAQSNQVEEVSDVASS